VVVDGSQRKEQQMSSKQREALSEILELIDKWRTDGVMEHWQYSQLFDIADNALSEPLKNCEVGTAEKQTERFKDLCRKYRRGPGPRANCKGCPIQHESPHVGCAFAWAQMPYKKEGEA
jgi:hypothetical protein